MVVAHREQPVLAVEAFAPPLVTLATRIVGRPLDLQLVAVALRRRLGHIDELIPGLRRLFARAADEVLVVEEGQGADGGRQGVILAVEGGGPDHREERALDRARAERVGGEGEQDLLLDIDREPAVVDVDHVRVLARLDRGGKLLAEVIVGEVDLLHLDLRVGLLELRNQLVDQRDLGIELVLPVFDLHVALHLQRRGEAARPCARARRGGRTRCAGTAHRRRRARHSGGRAGRRGTAWSHRRGAAGGTTTARDRRRGGAATRRQ